MKTIKVKPAEKFLLLKKWDVLRAIKEWQNAEADTEDEKQCEERLRKAVEVLLEWQPQYRDCLTVCELQHKLNQELLNKRKD